MRFASITDRMRGLGSGKWALHIETRKRIAAGAEIIELTIGEPDLPPDTQLLDVCSSAMYGGRTGYGYGSGDGRLAEAIAAKYSKRSGRTIRRDQVHTFPGTQTALYAAMMALAESGDDVLVGDPLYATYEGVIRSTGASVVPVPLHARHRFHMQAEDLERAITPRSRVLLLNSPHNPTGATLTAEEIAAIGEVCRKHDLWILSDEVYEDIIFKGTFASPFDNDDLADRTVALSSISKSHAAPGFRSGWSVGPVEFWERIQPLTETMLFGNPPFIADMTVHALTNTFDTATRLRDNYKRRAGLVVDVLADSVLEPLDPDAGMFILVDVSPTGLDGEAFAWRLLDAGVAVMPGSSFGENARDFIRLSLTVPDGDLTEACGRMANLANEIAGAKQMADAAT